MIAAARMKKLCVAWVFIYGPYLKRRAGIPGHDEGSSPGIPDRVSPLRTAGVVAWGDGVLVSDLAIATSDL